MLNWRKGKLDGDSQLLSLDVRFPRLYLINSPVVRAENLRFKEEGVRDVLKDVFLPWYNAYRFLVQNVHRLQKVADSPEHRH